MNQELYDWLKKNGWINWSTLGTHIYEYHQSIAFSWFLYIQGDIAEIKVMGAEGLGEHFEAKELLEVLPRFMNDYSKVDASIKKALSLI